MKGFSLVVILMALSVVLGLTGCKSPSTSRVVGMAADGSFIYVNPASVRKTNDGTIISMQIPWSSENVAKQKNTALFATNPVVADSFVIRFHCNQRKYDVLKHTWHHKDGATFEHSAKAGQDVMPNSAMEKTMEYACTSEWRLWLENTFDL